MLVFIVKKVDIKSGLCLAELKTTCETYLQIRSSGYAYLSHKYIRMCLHFIYTYVFICMYHLLPALESNQDKPTNLEL